MWLTFEDIIIVCRTRNAQYPTVLETIMIAAILLLFTTIFIGQNAAQDTPGAIIVSPPKYSKAAIGQTIRLTCAAYGNPTPSITWTRLSADVAARLSNSSSGYKQYDQTTTVDGTEFIVSVLEICGVTVSETDEYICTADNGVSGEGIASADEKFFLSVPSDIPEPPSIVVRPPSDGAAVEYGSTIEAVCVAYGNPLPTVTWSKQGCADISCSTNAQVFTEVISYGDVSYRKSVLHLCSVDESNSGSYTCSAKNGIDGEGVAAKSFTWQLTVNARPIVSTMSRIVPTTSCPNVEMPSSAITRGSNSGSGSPSPTTGQQILKDVADELSYQVVVGIETIVIAVLLVVLIVAIIVTIKLRSAKPKTEKPKRYDTAVQPHGYSSRRSEPYGVGQPQGRNEEERNIDEENTVYDDVSYANLVKKMEED